MHQGRLEEWQFTSLTKENSEGSVAVVTKHVKRLLWFLFLCLGPNTEEEPSKEEGFLQSCGLKLQSIPGWDMAKKLPHSRDVRNPERGIPVFTRHSYSI